jgi:hypothetical protein
LCRAEGASSFAFGLAIPVGLNERWQLGDVGSYAPRFVMCEAVHDCAAAVVVGIGLKGDVGEDLAGGILDGEAFF